MGTTRPLSDLEKCVLEQLLGHPFEGSDVLRDELSRVMAEPVDRDGSVKLITADGPNAPVNMRVPVEGEAQDIDGIFIHVLLHVVDGHLAELEMFKDDGSTIKNLDALRCLNVY
jgi:hypothetical protein